MVVAVTAVALATAWLIRPQPAALGDEATGDPALIERIRQLADDPPYTGMAVAIVDDTSTTTAGFGTTAGPDPQPVDERTPFETASISKVFTGMLLADLADNAHLDRDTQLGAIYPEVDFTDPQVAQTTLAELSTHMSGLPTTRPSGVSGALRTLVSTWLGTNPSGDVQPEDVVAAAATVEAGDRTTPIYPNFGVAWLGHALAEHERTPYPALLTDRLIDPLELTTTSVQDPDDHPPADHARPHRSNGAAVAPWVGHATPKLG